MREIASMIVVLSVICGISGFALSYLKQTTQPIIESQVLTYVQGPTIRNVFPAATNNPIEERKEVALSTGLTTVFPFRVEGKLVGVALETQGKGYGGNIGVMVGFDVQRDALLGIGITQMKETPGLGTNVAQPKFTGQFPGKGLDIALKSAGGTIDAVSGATISSTGTVLAVQQAATLYKELKPQISQLWP